MDTKPPTQIPKLQMASRRKRMVALRRFAGRSSYLTAGVLAGVLAAGGGFALAAATGGRIHGCENRRTGTLAVKAKCGKGTKVLTWVVTGPRGEAGATGPQGPAGTTTTVNETTTQAAWGTPTPWSSTASYTSTAPASVVTYDGSTYVATADSSDAEPDTHQSDWSEIAAAGANGTAVAWAQIDPPTSGTGDFNSDIADQNGNVLDFERLGTGDYSVAMTGCTKSDPQDASAVITPMLTSSPTNYYVGDLNEITNGGVDYPDDLVITFVIYDLTTSATADDDFSIEVNC